MTNGPDQLPRSALERKLVTILSADVAEYSRLMAEDEEQTLRIFREHSQIFRALVDSHHGRVFNTAGDAILAEFTSPVEAVRCATEIQAALRTRNDQLPSTRQVRFRIGINLGDVMLQNADLLGDGVNVAARLQGAAEPGGICVSGSVYDQIRNKLSLNFESLGERHFKNIPQPVRTFTITGTEDDGALPIRKSSSRRLGVLVKCIVGVMLLFALVGGYWAYSAYQRGQTDQIGVNREAGEHVAVAAVPTSRKASAPPSVQAVMGTSPSPSPPDQSHASPEPTLRDQPAGSPSMQQTDRQSPRRNLASSLSPRRSADQAQAPKEESIRPEHGLAVGVVGRDGVYAGQVCYGEGPRNPARCFQGHATVTGGDISGQWQIGPGGGTMLLSGTVAAAGDVSIEMHPDDLGGARAGRANLSGVLHDGRLDATGQFLNGRTVSFQWRRD